MIKTTVIVPVYNTELYVRECLESIFAQTQKEIEVIAIDDGSTDKSLEILEEMKQEYPQLMIISQENHGLGYTRNAGIDIARGEYIYFIDSDDCLNRKDALEICYEYAGKEELELVIFDADIFGDVENKKNAYDRSRMIAEKMQVVSGPQFFKRYFSRTYCPCTWLLYISCDTIKRYGIRFMPNVYYEDNEFYCRLMSHVQRMMYLPEPFYKRRYRKASITSSRFDKRHAQDMLKVSEAVWNLEIPVTYKETKRIAGKILQTLMRSCREEGLVTETALMKQILESVLQMYGNNIREISVYQYIDTLKKVCAQLPAAVVPIEILEEIKERQNLLFRKIADKIPFQNASCRIGIFGTGKYADGFLDHYEKYVGSIEAETIYIDSYRESLVQKYRSGEVYNIKDIGNLPLDLIVIMSNLYENEMYDLIKTLYGEKFPVLRLYGELEYE